MLLPSTLEYSESVLLGFFNSLRMAPVLDEKGQPFLVAGNFAITYKMRHLRTGKLKALKCFTRDQSNRHWRLREIARYFQDSCPEQISKPLYLEKEILVDSRHTPEKQFPVLLMDWASETTLGTYIKTLCETRDVNQLHRLSEVFDALACWLLNQPFAHGDLKCDNIMVALHPLRLILIDLDGMYLPCMQGSAALETGSPGYRHPGRDPACFDSWLDDFSLLLISTALHILIEKPDWYRRYSNGDNLLFTEKDLKDPSKSIIFFEAKRHIQSAGCQKRLDMLLQALCCRPGPIPGLYDLLSAPQGTPSGTQGHSRHYELTGSFQEGLALVAKHIGSRNLYRYGYINPKGEACIPLQYTDARHFSEGMAAVKQNGKWGYIGPSGEWVISPEYDDARSFKNGFAQVMLNRKWGYVRKDGVLHIPCIYDDCKPFLYDGFEVQIKGQWLFLPL